MTLADVDGNGSLDAIVANSGGVGTRVWMNSGVGSFNATGQAFDSLDSSFVAVADFDLDGDLDFAVANTVWSNDGGGTFLNTNQFSSGVAVDAVTGDLNGDGWADIFSTEGGANSVWLNDGAGGFAANGQDLPLGAVTAVSIGDVDGDGDLDTVSSADGQNRVWLNDGTGQFAQGGSSVGAGTSRGIALGDIDDDGDLDAFVANDGPNKVWTNDDAPFAIKWVTPGPGQPVVDSQPVIEVAVTQSLGPVAIGSDITVHASAGIDWASVSSGGGNVLAGLNSPLFPGELASLTVAGGLTGSTGETLGEGMVVQWRSPVSAGTGLFVNGGLSLGGGDKQACPR